MKYIWNIYIFTMLSFGIARTAKRIFRDSGCFSRQYLPLILSAIFGLGVYGCINKKPLFKLWFWKAFYWFSIIISFSLLAFALYFALAVGGSSLLWSGLLVLVCLFIITAQVKIIEYCFKSPQVW